MIRKTYSKYLPLLALVSFISLAGSCVMENYPDECDASALSSITLKVRLPARGAANNFTRAAGRDYDEVKDMNILISDKGVIRKRLYLDFAAMLWEDGTTISDGSSYGGVTIKYNDADGFRLFQLDFSDDYWTSADGAAVPLKTSQFHAVANWGSSITSSDDRDFVENLRGLTTTADIVENNGQSYFTVKTPNVMYGEITSDEPEIIDTAKPGEVRRVVTVGLKRTAAMITLAMNGEELDKGVVIELSSVSLHNVPESCTLGPGNVATTGNIRANGDYVGGPSLARGTLVGKVTQKEMPGFTAEMGYVTEIGGHYIMSDDKTVSVDYDKPIMPLFLYENMQGTGEHVTDQSLKRPAGVAGGSQGVTDDEKKQIMNAIASYNKDGGVCSYIEINGTYTKYADDMSIKSRGPVTWRFFLGADEYDDFNVERNKNYRLTLKLFGTGISEAETSWRVDDDTAENPAVVGETDMVVGGGGEMFCVQPNRDIASDYPKGLKLQGEKADFVYVYTRPSSKYIWQQVYSSTGNTNPAEASPDGKQIWFYVRPLLPDDPYEGNERSCTVEFVTQNGSSLTPPLKVTFTQYRPVTFSITKEDLDRYGSDPDLMEAKRLLETYYNHDFETGGDFKFYADRVDRAPLQWGFGGIQLDQNQNTGFENVYHLIDPLDANGNPIDETMPEYATCVAHKDYAKNYLPTGRGWNDRGSHHIDYNNGSCMMHAAMENYFQQFYPYPGASGAAMVTPLELTEMTALPPRPGSKDDPLVGSGNVDTQLYAWCVPSIVGWKLVEILDRFYKSHGIADRGFDPKYPVSKWVSYWTSNAATADLASVYPSLAIDGKNRSFVYQFGIGLDKIGAGERYPGYLLMNRTSKVRYRLLNIKPEMESGAGAR